MFYNSTEHDFYRSSIQYAWLERDLRSRTPWFIVGAHRQMYTSEADFIDEHQIKKVLHQYQVDVNRLAHRHFYEQTCSMFQQKCFRDVITNVLILMARQDLDSGSCS
jgi:hypothetical protein